jgi:hypothetical protein
VLALAFGSAGLSILVPGTALAQTVTFTITPTSGPIGAVVRFSGQGCPSGGVFRLHLGPQHGSNAVEIPQVSFSSASNSSYSGTVTVPSTMPSTTGGSAAAVQPGTYTTDVLCSGGGGAEGPSFTVTVARSTSTSSTVPPTTALASTTTTTVAATTTLPLTTVLSGGGSSLQAASTTTTVDPPGPSPTIPGRLAQTGNSRIGYWFLLAAISVFLGLACMFVTQRRRYRRIYAWLDAHLS